MKKKMKLCDEVDEDRLRSDRIAAYSQDNGTEIKADQPRMVQCSFENKFSGVPVVRALQFGECCI